MMKLKKIGVVGALLLLSLPAATQQGPLVVRLTVRHDGKEKPPPDQITISFDGHSAQIPVRDGKFKVPPEFTKANEVIFATDIGGDHILVTNLSGKLFSQEDWTLLLAERRYEQEHQSVIPKGTDIRSSCILVFESQHGDAGAAVFSPHCRSKRK